MRDSFKKFGAISLLVSPLIFLILTTIGMYLFPGGIEIDEIIYPAHYYRFKLNFFSDLGMLTTPTGKSNLPSSILFCIGMTIIGVAFILHSITLRSYFTENTNQYKWAKAGSIAGIISALGFIGIAFTPWDVLPVFHNIFVSLGFSVAGVYCVFFVIAIFKEKKYPNIFGILAITFLVTIVAYPILLLVSQPYDTFPGRILHVVIQKIVVYQMMVLLMIEGISSLFLLKKNR